jgi:nifR3 family TIM-barrel protein
MKNPALAAEIIRSVKNAVKCPVTVKFRSGWDGENKNAVEFAKIAEDAGCDALCIHGRTVDQGYSGEADIDLMGKVAAAVNIPVMVNGDVADAESGLRLLSKTGARFALIGRGALGNPWIFRECNAAMRGESIPPRPTLEERLDTFIHQTELAASLKGEKTACAEARTHFCHYLKGIKNAAKYRNEATGVTSVAGIRELAERILNEADIL